MNRQHLMSMINAAMRIHLNSFHGINVDTRITGENTFVASGSAADIEKLTAAYAGINSVTVQVYQNEGRADAWFIIESEVA